MSKPLCRPSLVLALSLSLLLTACAASSPRATGNKAAKAPAAQSTPARPTPKPAPVQAPPPAPAAETPTSSLIVMGTPLPGVPTPLASRPGTVPPVPVAAAPGPGEPKPFSPSPSGAAPDQTSLTPSPAPTDFSAAPGIAPQTPAPTSLAGPPPGYGGILWGTSARQVPGLTVHEVDAPMSVITYLWPAGPKDIVGAPIKDAYLEFYQDRFYHVWIDLDGQETYKAALAGLTAAYGPPTAENLEKHYHSWTVGDVNVYCAYHETEHEGDVSFFYQPLYDRLTAARKAAHGKGQPTRRGKS
jgi:hypothetical protein